MSTNIQNSIEFLFLHAYKAIDSIDSGKVDTDYLYNCI